MLIFINKNNIYLLQNNTNQSFYNVYIYLYVQTIFYIFFEMILYKRLLVFKTQSLCYHELIFCKLVNLQKLRY